MPGPDFQSEPVAHYSVKAIEALAHVGRSKSHVNPGRRPKSKHNSRILPVPRPPDANCAASKSRLNSIRRPLANTTAIAHGPSRSAVPLPPITLTRTSFLPSLWISPGLIRSRLSPRCNVLSLIPWIRQNSPRDRPLAPNSLTSRWTSCRVRRRRGLTSSGSVIRPLQQIPPRNGRCG